MQILSDVAPENVRLSVPRFPIETGEREGERVRLRRTNTDTSAHMRITEYEQPVALEYVPATQLLHQVVPVSWLSERSAIPKLHCRREHITV